MTETTSAASRDIVLLDGGVGQELYRRSTRPAAPLWSVQVMMDEPHLVEAVHLDFIEAGARIITANTYTATPHRLAREGKADMFEALHRAALAAATSAREKSGQAVRIAGCLPPLVGSYRADLTPPEAYTAAARLLSHGSNWGLRLRRVICGVVAGGVDEAVRAVACESTRPEAWPEP